MTSPDTSGADRLVDALTNLIPRLLHALDALGFVARYLYPPRLPDLLSDVGDLDRPLAEALADFNTIALPDHLTGFRTQIGTACEEIGRRNVDNDDNTCSRRSDAVLSALLLAVVLLVVVLLVRLFMISSSFHMYLDPNPISARFTLSRAPPQGCTGCTLQACP